MAEQRKYLHIPGHVPIKEAAARLKVSPDSVQRYIHKGTLPAQTVDGQYMIPEEAIKNFYRTPRGRKRKGAVNWRLYSDGVQVHALQIEVQILAARAEQAQQHLHSLASEQQHCFPGTMQRFIFTHDEDPLALTILLVWKDSELRNMANLQHDLDAFEEEFADLFAWETARYTRLLSPVHT